jgi:hypothetical protein
MSVLHIAQFLQAVAVVVGVVVAVCTIYVSARIQREQTARNAYIKYIELAFHHPEFAAPDWEKINFDAESFGPSKDPKERKKKFEQYCWFVSIMMHTVDFVFTAAPSNAVLQDVMILQIAYHWKYIDYFKRSKKHLAYRYDQHKDQIDKGIRIGRQGVS